MNKYNIIQLFNVDSTNDYILSLKKSKKFKEGLVVLTGFQSKGRGQRDNFWESKKGENLILSILIEPDILVERQFDISKIVSVSLMECLNFFGLNSKIKWPNDILIANKKVAGILIENIISKTGRITHSVIGIGLNVNQLIFNDYIPKATSLALELKMNVNLEEIQFKLLESIKDKFNLYRSDECMNDKYINALFKKDEVSVFETNSIRFNGIIRGVEDSGLLIVETENEIKRFDMKDVKMLF